MVTLSQERVDAQSSSNFKSSLIFHSQDDLGCCCWSVSPSVLPPGTARFDMLISFICGAADFLYERKPLNQATLLKPSSLPWWNKYYYCLWLLINLLASPNANRIYQVLSRGGTIWLYHAKKLHFWVNHNRQELPLFTFIMTVNSVALWAIEQSILPYYHDAKRERGLFDIFPHFSIHILFLLCFQ